MRAHVEQELIVAVLDELGLQHVADLLAELLLVLACSLAEDAVEQLLVHLGGLEVADFRHLVAEVAVQVLHLLLVNLQQGGNLSIVVGIGLLGVEGDNVAGLATVEELALLLVLDIGRHDHTAVGSDAALQGVALLVQLAQVAGQRVVAAEDLTLDELAGLRGVHRHLVVDELVVHLDGIVVHLVATAQLSLELGSNSDVEHKGEGAVLLQVLRLLLLAGQRLA